MDGILTNDVEIQKMLYNMKNYLFSQKEKYLANEIDHALDQHTEEIGSLEEQKSKAMLALDSMIKRLEKKPFYRWFEEKHIYSYYPKDSITEIRFADFVYAIHVLEELNTSHFSYESLTFFEKFENEYRNGNTMEDWRDGFSLKEAKTYLNLLDVLTFVLEQFSLMHCQLDSQFEKGISDVKKEKKADQAHLSRLQKTIKEEIKKRLNADFTQLKSVLQEKGKDYIEQKIQFLMNE